MLYRLDQMPNVRAGDGVNKNHQDLVSVYASTTEFVAAATAVGSKRQNRFEPDFHGEDFYAASRSCQNGNESYVAASDKIMAELEGLIGFNSSSFRTINDVVGGSPNIGNYLAGNPMSMRRRVRTHSEFAPITIVADLGLRAMNTDAEIARRGAAVLALVRILSTMRPVTLYVGACSRSSTNSTTATMVRVETAPLDLARAAYMTSSKAFTRKLCFDVMECQANTYQSLSTPYENMEGYLSVAHAYWNRIFPGDMIYVPRLVGDRRDAVARDPKAWLLDQLAKHGRPAE